MAICRGLLLAAANVEALRSAASCEKDLKHEEILFQKENDESGLRTGAVSCELPDVYITGFGEFCGVKDNPTTHLIEYFQKHGVRPLLFLILTFMIFHFKHFNSKSF